MYNMSALGFPTLPAQPTEQEHVKWTSGDPSKWQPNHANVECFHSSAESVDCDKKEITLMNKGPHAGGCLWFCAK